MIIVLVITEFKIQIKSLRKRMMKTPQRLISQVNQFLKSKHSIQISLPRLHSLIDSKVNLKITSPNISTHYFSLDKTTSQNRYKIIIIYIESLLSSSNLDLHAIDTFMNIFNKIINSDIDIMQKNQIIRNNSFKIKEKLQFRIQEISKRTQTLRTSIEKIHDKIDIIDFIAIDIKNYLLSVKLISDQYEQVRAVEVHTPLKIDHIYEYEYSSEEDYQDHYEPLLEVLVRLRANMLNLHQSVKNCDRIDLPLKSVNLLANCKNLLMQLQQYLITDHCAYNRLIFHVVTQQSQNMKLISNFYKNYLNFVKSLVYNVYKCVYLGHIFKKYYSEYEQAITQQKNKIIDLILKINVNIKPQAYIQIERTIKLLEQNLHTIRNKIKIIQNILCYGKTTIMQLYLEQKICKKLSLLLKQKNSLIQLQDLLKNTKEYIREVYKLDQERVELVKNKSEIEKEIVVLGQDSSSKDVAYYGDMAQLDGDRLEKIFNRTFVHIQDKTIRISQLQRTLKTYQKQCKHSKITQQFFPKLLQVTKQLREQYYGLQVKLLNGYQHMLSDQSQKQAKALQTANETIEDIVNYLTSESKEKGATYAGIGGQILNEDQHCEVVKGHLGAIDRAEFMMKSVRRKKKSANQNNGKGTKQNDKGSEYTKQLQKLRQYLEYLLSLYQASMDDHILQNMVDKMDFNEEADTAINKNIVNVKQLMGQLQKHNKELRKKTKQIRKKKNNENSQEQHQLYEEIDAKVTRIVRERHILYEILQVIYGEFLSVYVDLKSSKNGKKQETYNFQTKGVLLFNKKVYNYALLCYHCLNKINVVQKQLNDSNLAVRTKNFLNDQILQPYINRLKSYINFSEEQMLNLTLKLQKSLQLQKQYKNRMKKWQQSLDKYEGNQNQYKKKIKQKSKQLLQTQKSIQQIEQLSKKKFVILNMQDLKKLEKQCQDHFEIAGEIVKLEQYSQLCEGKLFKNEKLNLLIKKIQKCLPSKQ